MVIHGFIWDQHNDQLSVGLLALHRYRRGHGFKICIGLIFFQALFSLLLSSVRDCEDRSHIRFLNRNSHI